MAGRQDPLVTVGLVLIGIAAVGGFMVLTDGGGERRERRKRSRSGDKPDVEAQVADEARPAATKRKERLVSWVPSGAKEVTRWEDLPKKAKEAKGCRPTRSLIDLAKETVVGFERELRSSTRISDAEETRIGKKLEREAASIAAWRGNWDRANDRERYVPYVQKLVDSLAAHGQRRGIRYRVHVIRDKSFNAFALPGGVLAFHTGLFDGPDAVKSEAELAMVMGHEVAHVELRHPIAAYQYARALLGDDAESAQIITAILTTSISTEYELEADRLGLELATRAQYDPMAAARLWKRKGGDSSGGVVGDLADLVFETLETLLRSHPPGPARCYHATAQAARIREKGWHEVLYRGKTNVRRRIVGREKAF